MRKKTTPPARPMAARWRQGLANARAYLRSLVKKMLRAGVGEPPPPRVPTPVPPVSAKKIAEVGAPSAIVAEAAPRTASKSATSIGGEADSAQTVEVPAARAARRVSGGSRPIKGEHGTWSRDTLTAMMGRIEVAPLVLPSREFHVYEPAQPDAHARLTVMLHGCRQTVDEIARGTRLNAHADERGWLVLYPEQTKSANKYGCWNWFDPANLRGHGECALIVGMQGAVQKRYGMEDASSFLAGMSAGGALASILALRYPEKWAAIGIHSGLPYCAADDPFGALRVMREGARDLAAARTLRGLSPDAPGLPAIVVHGNEDDVVHRRNADLVVRQFLGWNGYFPGDQEWDQAKLPAADDEHVKTPSGHAYILRRYERKGLQPVHECEVIGMGHAWSGGDGSLEFNDKMGPDATALMMAFFDQVKPPVPAAVLT